MTRVNVRIHYVVAAMLGMDVKYIDLQKEFPEIITVETLFNELAAQFGPAFSQKVYTPESKRFNEGLSIIVNSRIMDHDETLQTVLEDGADVFVVPVYAGG